MDTTKRKAHWENVFRTKDTTKVSWYQPVPETSLRLIEKLAVPKTAKIIEVGSGDSYLGDTLLEKGFSDITLLDISEKALATIRERLAEKAGMVRFVAADITNFNENQKYDLWHDRAVLHFLTDKNDIEKYVENVSAHLVPGGYFLVGTFSENGPDKCSDLNVKQYSEKEMTATFSQNFEKIECFTENHTTPSGSSQNFLFCIFKRKN